MGSTKSSAMIQVQRDDRRAQAFTQSSEAPNLFDFKFEGGAVHCQMFHPYVDSALSRFADCINQNMILAIGHCPLAFVNGHGNKRHSAMDNGKQLSPRFSIEESLPEAATVTQKRLFLSAQPGYDPRNPQIRNSSDFQDPLPVQIRLRSPLSLLHRSKNCANFDSDYNTALTRLKVAASTSSSRKLS